ncbi:hypothetical protein HYW87_04515 [Candidatus Roizmanbacteria bacterium]|nr:hypothetical protein [Candidatus Roizmanbacteria bacterium]
MQEPIPSSETATPLRVCHLIPGISGTAKHWSRLEQALERSKLYDQIYIHDSSVSQKGYNPNHFRTLGELFLDNIEAVKQRGGSLDVLATSLATTDLEGVFKVIERETHDPNFFAKPENAQALRLILISPWGFVESISEAFSSIQRFGGLLKEMGTKGGDEMGIMSLQLVKPKEVNESMLADALTETYPERVQKIEDQPEVSTLDISELERQSEDYFKRLKSKDQTDLQKVDLLIQDAVTEKNWSELKKLLRQRGIVLYPYIWNVLQGKEIDDAEPVDFSKSMRLGGQLGISFLKRAPAIIQSTLLGKPYQRLLELMRAGASVNFLIPEFDQIVPARDIEDFINLSLVQGKKDKESRALNLKSTTHVSSYSMNQVALVNALRQLY